MAVSYIRVAKRFSMRNILGFLLFDFTAGCGNVADFQKEIDDQRNESKERWTALLDSNPIHHVTEIHWIDALTDERLGGATGPVKVKIGGIWGTVCVDNLDENAAEFFCRNLMTGGSEISSISHKELELHGGYPVLLTDVQCKADAMTVHDCTSGPMGFSNCASGNDTVLTCAFYYNPSE